MSISIIEKNHLHDNAVRHQNSKEMLKPGGRLLNLFNLISSMTR